MKTLWSKELERAIFYLGITLNLRGLYGPSKKQRLGQDLWFNLLDELYPVIQVQKSMTTP